MKKVLILANSAGGLYDFRNELLLKLLEEYEVVASLPDKVRVEELEKEGVRVVHTDINRHGVNPLQDYKLMKSYKELIKAEKPDLVLTYTIKPNIYGGFVCRLLRVPYIETITGLGTTFQKEGILKKLVVNMYRIGLKKSSCIIFQNSENKRIFSECKIKGKKDKLVPGSGVNLERHSYMDYPKEEDGVTRLLYIGRAMRDKGTDELLAAAMHFKDRSEVCFEFLGYNDGDYEAVIKEYSDRGIINAYGFDPDVKKYIAKASAIVLPTYHEGMSNVLQEASASGRPVIASNIPGCREIFEEGITGFSCAPKNSDSLIEAIEAFLKLTRPERAAMGKRAREKMEREFDRKMVADSYLEEIRSVI